MSRGLGKWQRFIMDQLQDGEWVALEDIDQAALREPPHSPTGHLYRGRGFCIWSRHESVFRAARTLKARGLVESRRGYPKQYGKRTYICNKRQKWIRAVSVVRQAHNT